MTKRAFPVSKSIKNSRKPSSAAQSPMKENIHAEAVFHIRELARAGRHEQAIELATRELSAAPESASVLMDLFELRAESHTAQGKLDLALQDANAMLALADGNEPALLAQALTCKARAQIHLGDLREAAQTANQALLTAKTVEPADRLLIAKSLLVLGEAQKSISDYKLAIETARKAASLFEMGGDLSNAGRAYLIMVPANNVLGNAKESRRAALTALDLCRQAGDQLGIGAAFNGLSSTDPDIAERIRHYQKAVEAFESAGHLERQSTAFGNLGFTYAALGLFIHAHRLTTKALGMTREMGAKVGMAYWLENLFDTELKLGDLDSARTHLHEYAQLARELGDARMDASVESNFSLLRLAEGNAADAVRHAQAAVDIATRAEMGNENVHLTHLAKAQLQNNEPAAALESTTRAVEFHRAQSFKLPDSFTSQEIWWRHAQALFANKKTNEARKALEQAHGFLIDAIANVRDEGLRRSYLNKDEANRELLQFWVADGAKRGLSRKRLFAHLAVETSTREPFKRLTDTGLRLNMLHTASAIHSFLVEEATELSGGERVMLILEKEDKLEAADSFLPRGEDAQTVLASIEPFLARARISRTVELILPLQDDSTRQLTPNQKSQIGNRKSQIVAPLIAQNQILGYLYADMDSLYGAFTETDRDMLGMLANQAAVSLENVNWAQGLEQKVGERTAELNSRVEELAIINSVQAGLAAQLDIQAIYELIGEQLRGLFDSQAISIVSFDVKKGTRHYHYLLEQGQRHEIPDAAIPPLSRFMIENKRPIMINENFKERLAAIGIPSTTLPGTKPTRSLLRVPILVDDEVRGAIGLDNVDRENAFSHTDMRLLTTLAGSMSVALENARLFQEIEEARKAADAASAAKSAFLANMSHELRTPLHAIIGFTRIVRRKSDGVLPEKQIENLEKVLSSGEHLLGLIDSVLDIAKIESGRMDVHAANFNIAALIDQCYNIAVPLLKPGIALEKNIGDGIAFIHSDQEKIKQIILNLLGNAAKFTHVGRIALTVEKANKMEYSEKHAQADTHSGDWLLPASAFPCLLVSVADTGIGIDEEAMGRIFGEFQQADTSATREYGGTGLGLTISRNLARLLGGDLTAASEPGKGSTFTFLLPMQYRPGKTE